MQFAKERNLEAISDALGNVIIRKSATAGYENVPGMLSHDGGNTWNIISEIFNSLGYEWRLFKLKATDYGIPQNRTRIFVVGFDKKLEVDLSSFEIQKKELKTKKQKFLPL